LSEVSSCLHAATYTPAGTQAWLSLVRSPALAAFPGNGSGRLLRYQFRGLIGCSLALRPARSRVAPRATFASKASTASLPPLPLRLLPAGANPVAGRVSKPAEDFLLFTAHPFQRLVMPQVASPAMNALTASALRRSTTCSAFASSIRSYIPPSRTMASTTWSTGAAARSGVTYND